MGDASSLLTQARCAVLRRWLEMGSGELQRRVVRGDEDDRLVELIDAFDAYFVVLRAKLGHNQVPISTWETYEMIRWRAIEIRKADRGES